MDSNWVDIVIQLVSGLGFPVFVAIWLLVKTDKNLAENTKALKQLVDVLKNSQIIPERLDK